MTNTARLYEVCPVSGVLTIRAQKLRTIAAQTPASSSKTPAAESLLTGLFCRCAGNATGLGRMLSTRLAKRLFGKIATRFYGRSISTQSAAITRKRNGSSGKRHFGFGGGH